MIILIAYLIIVMEGYAHHKMETWIIILFGLLGGIVRAFVGVFKHKVLTGKERFKSGKFLFTIIGSGIIGLFCALLTVSDYRISLLAGYAGTDVIQGIYKITKGKTHE